MDSLRPRGTVEVMCSHEGCRWAFWIDPVDPRLPAGPFDCGADHDTQARTDAVSRAMEDCGYIFTGMNPGGARVSSRTGTASDNDYSSGLVYFRVKDDGKFADGKFVSYEYASLEELERLPSLAGALPRHTSSCFPTQR